MTTDLNLRLNTFLTLQMSTTSNMSQVAPPRPLFPQSNGQVERTVKTVKRLIRDSQYPYMAIMTFRSTPFAWCKRSPAELLMGRRIRGNIPILTSELILDWSYLDDFCLQNKHFKEQQKEKYNRRHGVQDLPPIPDDTDVWVTTGNQPATGTVLQPANTSRSYIVNTPTGQVRRNTTFKCYPSRSSVSHKSRTKQFY